MNSKLSSALKTVKETVTSKEFLLGGLVGVAIKKKLAK